MKKIALNDNWTMTVLGKNVYDIPETPIKTKVPSTVYGTLLEKNMIPDPYYRDEELRALKLMENDFLYETEFTIGKEERESDLLLLRFEGIDTLARVTINDIALGEANNMNRVWEYDLTELVKKDATDTVYHLKIHLFSPTKYILEENENCPVGCSPEAMPGFSHIRKAACMYGWDWGPRLPDAGLFREVYLVSVNTARFSQVHIRQEHKVTGKKEYGEQTYRKACKNIVEAVKLKIDAEVEVPFGVLFEKAKLSVTVMAPEAYSVSGDKGSEYLDAVNKRDAVYHVEGPLKELTRDSRPAMKLTGLCNDIKSSHLCADVLINDPLLWWPAGYGEQPLYKVKVELCDDNGEVFDVWENKIGLRTITVNTDLLPDETYDAHLKGQSEDLEDGKHMLLQEGERQVFISDKQAKKLEGRNFAFEVNGLQIFAMGADYIPEDNLLTRLSKGRTELLLSTVKESNYNCIRIWGGGYFLEDYFYDLCDEMGLLVWHDLMFACASYELTDAFEKNISAEIRQNIRRLRSHPSIALWCGNNEMETQYETWSWPKSQKQYYDYLHIYEYIIPKIIKEEDPDTFYWPSSPSSGGNYENSNAENVGDVHYWGVWHGNEPFTAYRSHHYRFLSEFGFQSFPALQTVKRFTEEGERNIFSRVMEMHQRNTAANGKIMNYIAQTYLYPKNFDELLYASQLLQADAIRYGVEHFRRFRGTCMGAVVWQLNDIWPVASWSSVDYYGNWKALQYAEKRMFAPVLLSCEEHGEIDQKPYVNTLPKEIDVSADLHVANETSEEVQGLVNWSLRMPDSSIVREGSFLVKVPAFDGVWLPHLDFNGEDPLKVHLYYELIIEGKQISSGTTLFCAPKHYAFLDPKLSVNVEGDTVTVTSQNYAKYVSVETEEGILRLDDNFVDMEAGTKVFHILQSRDFTVSAKDKDVECINCKTWSEMAVPSGAYRARSVYEMAER